MPTKKKKYNARFPPARIKKIMQKDEEVGKVASTVPVMISRLLELFTESLILKTNELTLSLNARTLTTGHLKQIILSERKFDFLKDLVMHIPDVQANDDDGGDSNSEQSVRIRQRGRPRKKKEGDFGVPKKRGRKPKTAAPPAVDDPADEDITDGSETEDADSCSDEEDGYSASEDAGGASCQSRKRQRVDSSVASTCSSSSSVHCSAVSDHGTSESVATPDNCSVSLANRRRGEMFQSEATSSHLRNVPTTFRNSGADKTAKECHLPLNVPATGFVATTANAITSASDFTSEIAFYSKQQLPVAANFGRTLFGPIAIGLSVPPQQSGLCPPPAHRPMGQISRPLIMPTCSISLNTRIDPVSRTASEFLPQGNSTSGLMSPGTAPGSAGSLVEDVPFGSRVLSDGTPPITMPLTSTSSGHAVHRMPVVPASFLPGAILARSMSVPNSYSATKPSSLATLPEEDYDS